MHKHNKQDLQEDVAICDSCVTNVVSVAGGEISAGAWVGTWRCGITTTLANGVAVDTIQGNLGGIRIRVCAG